MDTPLRYEINKIDMALEDVGLPESIVVASGGYGALTRKIRGLLHFLLTRSSESNADGTDNNVPSTGYDRLQALLSIIQQSSVIQHELDFIKQCWDPSLPVISLPRNSLIDEHVVRIANTFPISKKLLVAPETVAIDLENLDPGILPSTAHDTLQDEIYMWITSRPTPSLVALPDDAVQQSIQLASQVSTTQQVLSSPEQFDYMLGGYLCETSTCFIFDATRPTWTYTYLTGAETSEKIRVYISLNVNEALRIGVHFVHIINILLKNNIRFSHAKGQSPNHVLLRKDSIVLHIHEEDVTKACQLLYDYGKDGVLDTDEYNAAGLQSSGTPGISTAFEPSDKEGASTIFTLQGRSKSFNSYIAARAYPLVLQRILNQDDLHTNARQQFQREFDRIKAMFCLEN